ncbi:hypothetical protein KCU70_g337, partial [Aureobasidium melanogenum]
MELFRSAGSSFLSEASLFASLSIITPPRVLKTVTILQLTPSPSRDISVCFFEHHNTESALCKYTDLKLAPDIYAPQTNLLLQVIGEVEDMRDLIPVLFLAHIFDHVLGLTTGVLAFQRANLALVGLVPGLCVKILVHLEELFETRFGPLALGHAFLVVLLQLIQSFSDLRHQAAVSFWAPLAAAPAFLGAAFLLAVFFGAAFLVTLVAAAFLGAAVFVAAFLLAVVFFLGLEAGVAGVTTVVGLGVRFGRDEAAWCLAFDIELACEWLQDKASSNKQGFPETGQRPLRSDNLSALCGYVCASENNCAFL